jgi:hypothetical protein
MQGEAQDSDQREQDRLQASGKNGTMAQWHNATSSAQPQDAGQIHFCFNTIKTQINI